MQRVKVENMESPRSGRPVANQFVITTDEGVYFQSYGTVIAFVSYEGGARRVVLDARFWDYSRTTSRYRNEFLHETTDETRRNIKDGTYTLADLNA